MSSWQSIELRVHEARTFPPSVRSPGTVKSEEVDHYIETAEGRRYSDAVVHDSTGGGSHISAYCDARRCAKVIWAPEGERQQRINITRSFMNEGRFGRSDRPAPLRFFYVGKVPLHEALTKAEARGVGKHLGRECDLFLFRSIKWGAFPQDLVYSLDRLTGVPLKVEAYKEGGALVDENLVWRWQSVKVEFAEGSPLPSESESVEYRIDGQGAKSEHASSRIQLKNGVINQHYDEHTFWPIIQPNVEVIDAVTTKKIYRTPSTHPLEKKPPRELATTSAPIRAEPPRDWTRTASTFAVVAGLVIVLAGVVLWLRRR